MQSIKGCFHKIFKFQAVMCEQFQTLEVSFRVVVKFKRLGVLAKKNAHILSPGDREWGAAILKLSPKVKK